MCVSWTPVQRIPPLKPLSGTWCTSSFHPKTQEGKNTKRSWGWVKEVSTPWFSYKQLRLHRYQSLTIKTWQMRQWFMAVGTLTPHPGPTQLLLPNKFKARKYNKNLVCNSTAWQSENSNETTKKNRWDTNFNCKTQKEQRTVIIWCGKSSIMKKSHLTLLPSIWPTIACPGPKVGAENFYFMPFFRRAFAALQWITVPV